MTRVSASCGEKTSRGCRARSLATARASRSGCRSDGPGGRSRPLPPRVNGEERPRPSAESPGQRRLELPRVTARAGRRDRLSGRHRARPRGRARRHGNETARTGVAVVRPRSNRRGPAGRSPRCRPARGRTRTPLSFRWRRSMATAPFGSAIRALPTGPAAPAEGSHRSARCPGGVRHDRGSARPAVVPRGVFFQWRRGSARHPLHGRSPRARGARVGQRIAASSNLRPRPPPAGRVPRFADRDPDRRPAGPAPGGRGTRGRSPGPGLPVLRCAGGTTDRRRSHPGLRGERGRAAIGPAPWPAVPSLVGHRSGGCRPSKPCLSEPDVPAGTRSPPPAPSGSDPPAVGREAGALTGLKARAKHRPARGGPRSGRLCRCRPGGGTERAVCRELPPPP